MARIRSLPDPRLSPEVHQYLKSRGIPFPDCPPFILTPEPTDYPGAVFDFDRVDLVRDVFQCLRHTQGEWAGRPLKPDPWQVAYILAPVFGWVAPNDAGQLVRIIRKVHIEVPRKGGKTTLAGGIATYLTCADGEQGAQVYAVATGKQQARYCFDPVKAIAEKSPDLGPFVKITADRIVHTSSASYFAVVASIADLLHGANVHGAIVDELHVHKDGKLVEAVETGMGARQQPLMVTITTADDSRQTTVYAQRRERIEQLARGAFKDPSTFGVIWAADPKALAGDLEYPFQESTWRRANPGYGISPTRRFMVDAAAQARQSPANLASFLRLHLNLRTKQDTRYLDLGAWDANLGEVSEESLTGCECYGGLDLASTGDLCALCWDFPDGEGGHRALWRLWIPEGGSSPPTGLVSLDLRTAGSASIWARQGLLTVTPGNVADYSYIRNAINQDRARFSVQELAYDPWNSTQLVNDLLADGAPMVQVRQGFASMSPPTKELQRLLLEGSGRYLHGANPAVRWQVDNFAVEMDAAGNVKPSRKNASDKIDAVVSALMALDRAMRHEGAGEPAFLGSA
ncbi:MAG: terminase [Candidatus Dormiibacter spiritus]|nr:MAG: terminase [Candidatus Dormibacteraeota bacterium]